MYLGDYIVIERQTAPFEFIGCCVSTGTEFIAPIDEDKREIFSDQSWIREYPSACPFLRPSGGMIICTIHESSPVQCKRYRCTVFRISSPTGEVIGRVTGELNLHTEDPGLRSAWDDLPLYFPWSQENSEDMIRRFLEERGYLCI
jgi:Fe-S-cluster containining protein